MIKKLIKFIFYLFFFPLKKIIPKGNIILFGTYSRHIYRENTRYLFEYISKKNAYQCYWITDNNLIKQFLKKKNLRYISFSSPLHMIWILLRTKVIIDSGTGYFNPFKIIDNGSTIKITTLHGNGPKANFSRSKEYDSFSSLAQLKEHLSFDYVNYPSDYSVDKVGRKSHLLPNNKIINLGYPRCDQFFDKDFVNKRFQQKKYIRYLFDNYQEGSKIIFYTPTWRPYDFNFPLCEMEGFTEHKFNDWLSENNFFFVYSIHTALKPKNILKDTNRICNLDMNKDPFLDINSFMLEVDILLNDYSTTSTEFAILNRPQVFFMPDYEEYLNEKGFIEDYREIMPGKEIFNFSDFKSTMNFILNDEEKYLNEHYKTNRELIRKYYDLNDGSSSEKFLNFIKKILS